MDDQGFDALARDVATKRNRRVILVGFVAAIAGVSVGRGRIPGAAQNAATSAASPAPIPVASPIATPGVLDVVSGSPPAAVGTLDRQAVFGCTLYHCYDAAGKYQSRNPVASGAPFAYEISVDGCRLRCGDDCSVTCVEIHWKPVDASA